MFRAKRSDTLVGTIEETYGINLNARRDMRIGNLLAERGFDSVTQLVKAAKCRLELHPRERNVFLSFHAEDLPRVNGFRLMMKNKHLKLHVSDDPNRHPVDSEQSTYIKRALRTRIGSVDVLICMIGHGTAWRDWVDWEINTALQTRAGICGIRLKGSRGRAPSILHEIGAPVASWGDVRAMIAAIEQAAAVRS